MTLKVLKSENPSPSRRRATAPGVPDSAVLGGEAPEGTSVSGETGVRLFQDPRQRPGPIGGGLGTPLGVGWPGRIPAMAPLPLAIFPLRVLVFLSLSLSG